VFLNVQKPPLVQVLFFEFGCQVQ